MKVRIAILAVASVFTVVLAAPALLRGQQPSGQDHEQHHPAAAQPAPTANQQADMSKMMAEMKARDQKLDELVAKMNAAKGSKKTDAIAELLTALVQEHRLMHETMMSHMSMMNMMGGMHEPGAGMTAPKK